MDKRGQLVAIEIKFFIIGFLVGLGGGLALINFSERGKLPFKIPIVCGASYLVNNMSKKGQLLALEFHFAWIGAVVGLVGAGALVFFGRTGVLPFQLPLCVLEDE